MGYLAGVAILAVFVLCMVIATGISGAVGGAVGGKIGDVILALPFILFCAALMGAFLAAGICAFIGFENFVGTWKLCGVILFLGFAWTIADLNDGKS
jgi:hypothetical protein